MNTNSIVVRRSLHGPALDRCFSRGSTSTDLPSRALSWLFLLLVVVIVIVVFVVIVVIVVVVIVIIVIVIVTSTLWAC